MKRFGGVRGLFALLIGLLAVNLVLVLVWGSLPAVYGLNPANVVDFGATGLMVWRVRSARGLYHPWLPLTAGMISYSLGFIVYAEFAAGYGHVSTPSPADALWLAIYPGAYATVVLLGLRRLRGSDPGLWLDGVVIGLATTALGAAFLFRPVLDHATGGPATVATTLAYPLSDVTLLALVVATLVLSGARPLRTWSLLAAGFAIFAIGDSFYVGQATTGQYEPGHLVDISWPAGLLLLVAAAWQPKTTASEPSTRGLRRLVLALPSAAIALMLLLAGRGDVGGISVGLAVATLVCALARMTYSVMLEGRLEATRVQAMTDSLTGLGNRRNLLAHLEETVATATADAPGALVLFDLNGFKHYNDTFGHLAGDELLTTLAHRFQHEVGARGGAYRLGGDEFCALLTGDPRTLDGLLPRLEAALSEPNELAAVGCAYGVALLPHEAHTTSEALALADRRMYEQKDRERRSTRVQMRDLLLAVLEEQHPDLHLHSTEVARHCRDVAVRLGMSAQEVDVVALAGELHDVGKIGVPDAILRKPGPLDSGEWDLIRGHTVAGERLLSSVPSLAAVAPIVRSSHERWDGAGYPDGLVADATPLAARIVAACDAFDAMVSDRPYCAARTPEDAIDELRRNAGSQFDADVVEVLAETVTAARPAPRRRPAIAPVEPRLSTIASLRGLLEVTRLVRRAGSLSSVLDAIARAISDSLGLETVVINLRRPGTDVFEVVTAHGSDEVRDAILGTSNDWSEWEPLLDERFHRRGAYQIRAGEFDWGALGANRVVVGTSRGDDPWLWDPEDELFVPFYSSDQEILGILSVGEPRSGRRPTDEELDVLVAMAEHAAAAVESLQTANGERPRLAPVRQSTTAS